MHQINPEDDNFHARTDNPYWNESAWFSFFIPERNVDGWLYVWHRPNMNLSAGGVAVWDGSGTNSHDCLYYSFEPFNPMPENADMFSFELANGLRFHCEEPLTSYDVGFKGDGCEMDLHFDAVMPVQGMRFGDHTNTGMEVWGNGHYDQAGRMRGTITIQGERYDVDCIANRDHSWGPRAWGQSWNRGGYEFANSPDGTMSLLMLALTHVSSDEDPFLGTTEPLTYGWFRKDDQISTLVFGERRVVERGPDGRPQRLIINARDELGREIEAEGRLENVLNYHASFFAYWGLMNWTINGEHAWGETQDCFRPEEIRLLIKKLREQAAHA
jgi:hypothetical protein